MLSKTSALIASRADPRARHRVYEYVQAVEFLYNLKSFCFNNTNLDPLFA